MVHVPGDPRKFGLPSALCIVTLLRCFLGSPEGELPKSRQAFTGSVIFGDSGGVRSQFWYCFVVSEAVIVFDQSIASPVLVLSTGASWHSKAQGIHIIVPR